MKNMKQILVVEDDLDIQEIIQSFLEEAQFQVITAYDGLEACDLFLEHKFDLVILDIMLPKIDGFAVCEFIRNKSTIPIIFLTALDSEDKQIQGFDLDIDDYVTKPFSVKVLVKKVEAILKRTQKTTQANHIIYKDLTLELDAYKAYVKGIHIELTTREFEIIRELILNCGIIITRSNFIAKLWPEQIDVYDEVVNTHIKNIRKKLGIDYIQTVRGVGYKVDKITKI